MEHRAGEGTATEKQQQLRKKKQKKQDPGTPAVARSGVRNRTSVQEGVGLSLALLSGLRIQRCPELWCRWQMRLGSGVAVAVVQAGSCSSHGTP